MSHLIIPVLYVKVPLSAAQIKSGNSSPILLPFPASGAGYYYRVTSMDCHITGGTIPFGILALEITSTTKLGTGAAQLSNTLTNSATSGFARSFINGSSDSIAPNDTLSLFSTSDSVVGDLTIDCYIQIEKVVL